MDLKNIVAKIAAKNANTQFGLGKAFQDIAEPVQAIDAPVNKLIRRGAEKFADVTDLKKGATGQADEIYQPLAQKAFTTFADVVVPTPSSLLTAGGSKILKANPAAIVSKMQKVDGRNAAQMFRDAKSEIGSKFGTVVVKDSPSAVGKVRVIDSPKPSIGSVIVKP